MLHGDLLNLKTQIHLLIKMRHSSILVRMGNSDMIQI